MAQINQDRGPGGGPDVTPPQTLTQIAAQALLGVPAFLRSTIDGSKLTVVAGKPTAAYGHPAIASIADDDPSKIIIHDPAKFLKATPAQQSGLLAHELTHAHMDQAPKTIQSKFAPVNPNDPYSFDSNNLNQPITKFSPEQLAKIVETNTTYQNDPSISAARKAQVAQQTAPVIQQLSQLPQATISNDQSEQSNSAINPTINTTPNPPAGQFDARLVKPKNKSRIFYDASPPVTPVESAPSTSVPETVSTGTDDNLQTGQGTPGPILQPATGGDIFDQVAAASSPQSVSPAASTPTTTAQSSGDIFDQVAAKMPTQAKSSQSKTPSSNVTPDSSAWSYSTADLSRAIQHTEGPVDPRTNNPGNLRLAPGQTGPVDSRGIRIFPTAQAGWEALQHDLEVKQAEHPGWSMSKLMSVWSPLGDGDNDPDAKTKAALQFLQKNASGATSSTQTASTGTDIFDQVDAKNKLDANPPPPQGTLVKVNGKSGVVQGFNKDTGKVVVDWGSAPRLNPFAAPHSNVSEVSPEDIEAHPNQLSSFVAGAALPFQGAVKQTADIDAAHGIHDTTDQTRQDLSDSQDQLKGARDAHPIAGYAGEVAGAAVPALASGVPAAGADLGQGVVEGISDEISSQLASRGLNPDLIRAVLSNPTTRTILATELVNSIVSHAGSYLVNHLGRKAGEILTGR